MSTVWPTSALAAADTAFAALTTHPHPLELDLDQLDPSAGLPSGVMALPALRDWLLARPDAALGHQAVWTELIARARTGPAPWVIAAVGMAMPALLRSARELRAAYPGDPEDIDGELLCGFLAVLRDARVPAGSLSCGQLCWAAWRAGQRLVRQAREHISVENVEHVVGSRPPRVPYGHPDLLIARAVALGLLDEDDARAWIDTRLGWLDPLPIAARRGLSVDALRMRLGRVDQRLATALADGLLTSMPSPQAAIRLQKEAAHRAATRLARAASAA